jgi:phosphoglycerate kinase
MPKTIPKITDVADLKGKKVLLRASLNVPMVDGVVANKFRLLRSLETITWLKDQGAKVIVVAHIGRKPEETLKPVFDIMAETLPVKWSGELVGETTTEIASGLSDGEVLLLENVRSDEREAKNDLGLAEALAGLADIYVNDAFSDSHREHSSLVGVTKYLPSYFGNNFVTEYQELSKAMTPESPSLFILGGAKFETKLPLISKYADHYTNVFIGGALAHDIFIAQGLSVGKSLVSDIDLKEHSILSHPNILVPVDVTLSGPNGTRITTPQDVAEDETILDAGPATIAMLQPYISEAKTILWNGPLGNYEKGFAKETEELAKAIAAAPGFAVVGGGDTVASIESLNLQDQFGFLSTAGGAMLTFLETGTLVAIDAVLNKVE